MSYRMQHVSAWILFLALLAAGCDQESVVHQSRAVVGGSYSGADTAVVAVLSIDAGGTVVSFCSGTVVTPHVVVTSAHCLIRGDSYSVYFGSEPFGFFDSTYVDSIPVTETILHPSFASTGRPYYEDWDVGAVALARPAPVTPIAINRIPLDPFVGNPIRFVGYGCSRCGVEDQGVKREGAMSLRRVDALQTYYGDSMVSTCAGDSGAPALITIGGREFVASIHSGGEIMDCSDAATGFRVDAFAESLLDPFIRRHDSAGCSADGLCATGCAVADPDCPCALDGFCGACPDPSADTDCSAVADAGAEGGVDASMPADAGARTPDPAAVDAGMLDVDAGDSPVEDASVVEDEPLLGAPRDRGCAVGPTPVGIGSSLQLMILALLLWQRSRRRA